MIELGENPDPEDLVSTPRRIGEMYNEIFAGAIVPNGVNLR